MTSTPATHNQLQTMLAGLRWAERKQEEEANYGTAEGQTEAIKALLFKLAEPQSHRDVIETRPGHFQDLKPISKYMCVQVRWEELDRELHIHRETFRMDDELCDDVEMPHGSYFCVVSRQGNGRFDELYIPNFCKSLPVLDRIRRHLEAVVPFYVLRGRYADFSSEQAAADGQ